MRRGIVILLCLCFILTGCNSKKNNDINKDSEANSQGKDTINDTTKDDEKGIEGNTDKNTPEDDKGSNSSDDSQNKPDTGLLALKLNEEWSQVITLEKEKAELNIPAYEAKVEPYTIAKDLSNVENIGQFSGFTKEQIASLANNGFVVVPSNDTRIFYSYDDNEYKGIPNFITTDSVLHIYHQFYDKSLMLIEMQYLYNDLDLLTEQMLDKSVELLQELKDEDLKSLQGRNVIYFLVARMLMLQSSNISVDAPVELLDMAKAEYALIDAAQGYVKSPYLGFDFDYSQFGVRGHYTRSEELGRYFKTMMWLGTAPFPFFVDNEYKYDNTLQALLMTYTTFLDSEATCNAELWSSIYLPTSEYVGLSDDIDVFTLNGLRKEVFGNNNDPNLFNDKEYYDKLYEAVKALPEPEIKGSFIILDTPTDKQFRYMGQRYILDSFVMQELMDPIYRPIPTSLDVMGVLGSNVAEDLVFNYYKPQQEWPEYEEKYNSLKNEVSGYSEGLWSNNLYNGWLWTIKEALTEFDANSGMPYFMTNDAWRKKALSSALGSYTELKHDTVLYGKQPVAEMGGPGAYADYHYIEPNIPLYSKLLYLTDYTVRVLEDQNMMNPELAQAADNYKEVLSFLMNCSIKELRNEALSEEEYHKLLWYGGTLEAIAQSLLDAIAGGPYSGSKDVSDMLVTDIATCKDQYLSLGTGYFDHIYVIFQAEGKLYLSRGSVYSHYEFVSNSRLTDEEWWELQGIKIVNEDSYEWIEFMDEKSPDLPEQPFWVKEFKSEVNNVMIQELEVDWNNLTE